MLGPAFGCCSSDPRRRLETIGYCPRVRTATFVHNGRGRLASVMQKQWDFSAVTASSAVARVVGASLQDVLGIDLRTNVVVNAFSPHDSYPALTTLQRDAYLALAARAAGAHLVLISSDEVFTLGRPALTQDIPKPGPKGWYQYMREQVTAAFAKNYTIVRTGRLFGVWGERELESLASGRLDKASTEPTSYTCVHCFAGTFAHVFQADALHYAAPPRVLHIASREVLSAHQITRITAKLNKTAMSSGVVPTEYLGEIVQSPVVCWQQLMKPMTHHYTDFGSIPVIPVAWYGAQVSP